MNLKNVSIVFFGVLLVSMASAQASPVISLGTAASFAVLGGSAVTDTGSSVIVGSVGASPGGVTGFTTVNITGGSIHSADATAAQAQSDLTTAINQAAGSACNTGLTGQDLGGLTLTPGVYCFSSSAQLTGTLTLNALGDPNAEFLFQIASTLTTSVGSAIDFSGAGTGADLFWLVGSSATLGVDSDFSGSILANTSITLNSGADISCGRALASNGAVTLDTNTVSINSGCAVTSGSPTAVPEPATEAMFALALFVLAFARAGGAVVRRRRI
jgi:type VI secretion system secreted protein VgrG